MQEGVPVFHLYCSETERLQYAALLCTEAAVKCLTARKLEIALDAIVDAPDGRRSIGAEWILGHWPAFIDANDQTADADLPGIDCAAVLERALRANDPSLPPLHGRVSLSSNERLLMLLREREVHCPFHARGLARHLLVLVAGFTDEDDAVALAEQIPIARQIPASEIARAARRASIGIPRGVLQRLMAQAPSGPRRSAA